MASNVHCSLKFKMSDLMFWNFYSKTEKRERINGM